VSDRLISFRHLSNINNETRIEKEEDNSFSNTRKERIRREIQDDFHETRVFFFFFFVLMSHDVQEDISSF
jgi:hypothetical protein